MNSLMLGLPVAQALCKISNEAKGGHITVSDLVIGEDCMYSSAISQQSPALQHGKCPMVLLQGPESHPNLTGATVLRFFTLVMVPCYQYLATLPLTSCR